MKIIYNSGVLYLKHLFVIAIFSIVLMTSCKKFVIVDPPVDSISSVAAFSNNTGAIAAMTGVYINMKANSGKIAAGGNSIGFLTGLGCDELKNYNTGLQNNVQFYTNTLNSLNPFAYYAWSEIYTQLHVVNVIIENLNKSSSITPTVKRQIEAEAKFMRAFFHFYAVNLFGKIPLVITSDFKTNNVISRSDVEVVYQQIIRDLNDAKINLSENIVDGAGAAATTRVRPNKWAATALLARVYLYHNEWAKAELESSKFLNNSVYTLESNLDNTFLLTSQEAIWQLQGVANFSTYDGKIYILTAAPGAAFSVALSSQLINAFESGDARFLNWTNKYNFESTDYYYPFKYKIGTVSDPTIREHTMVLRTAEQFLISAEAKIQQGKIADGIVDLNILRQRARLSPTVTVPDPLPDLPIDLSKEDALKAVMHERQVELFTEWGHRWFDLKRTGEINTVMTAVAPSKNTEWHSYQAWWPVPNSEILLNTNLDQNEGYN
jgi:starch-binding outer membrane protein, SusD/RagB family